MFGFWNHHDRLLERTMWAFGEAVVVFPVGGDPAGYAVRGVFDSPPAHTDLAMGVELSNQAPWVGFRVVELPEAAYPEQGMLLEARGARWEVSDVEADGGGHVKCRLFRVGPGSLAPLPPVDELAPIPAEEAPS
jgi:hypothetical protein